MKSAIYFEDRCKTDHRSRSKTLPMNQNLAESNCDESNSDFLLDRYCYLVIE